MSDRPMLKSRRLWAIIRDVGAGRLAQDDIPSALTGAGFSVHDIVSGKSVVGVGDEADHVTASGSDWRGLLVDLAGECCKAVARGILYRGDVDDGGP